jgi:phosphohistidine phosphatase
MKTEQAPYPAWIYRQSAALPYRWHGDDLEVLLITSRGAKRWILPKGIVEPGLTARASAAKEALEEAGLDGESARAPLGSYRHRKWGGTCEVEVYPFRVWSEMDDWPESGVRRRRWLPLSEALRLVEDRRLREIIAGLSDVVEKPAAETEPAGRQDSHLSRPPRLIYLFRHAKSSWEDPDLEDFDRPLALRGERACESMARYIALADIRPDLVLCSAALRTGQTVEGVRPALGDQAVVKLYRGLYLAGPQAMLSRLRRTADDVRSVMLVGHNPGMQSLAMRLAGSGVEADLARLAKKYPTGALATLVFRGRSWSDLEMGTCELHSLVRPGDIGEKREAKKDVKTSG